MRGSPGLAPRKIQELVWSGFGASTRRRLSGSRAAGFSNSRTTIAATAATVAGEPT
jgi:hypothetical protein